MAQGKAGEREETRDRFHMWMGRCIAQWSDVEAALYRLCEDCITHDELASIVYYRAPTVESRLLLVEELVKALLPGKKRKSGGHDHPDVKLWDRILKDARALLPVRNRIAHNPAIFSRNELLTFSRTGHFIGVEGALYYSSPERRRKSNAEKRPLILKDLIVHYASVINLTIEMRQFHDVLIKHIEGSPPPDPAPIPPGHQEAD